MSRLTSKVGPEPTSGQDGVGNTRAMNPEAGPVNGIRIDGVTYQLEGQPPIARGGQWWPGKRAT